MSERGILENNSQNASHCFLVGGKCGVLLFFVGFVCILPLIIFAKVLCVP